MAEITCTVYKVKMNGAGPKRYFAKFSKISGVVKSHERMDDAMLFTLVGTKMVSIVPGEPRMRKKVTQHFAVRYDSLEGETPFELHGKTVTVTPKKISVK
jgi:hypothetical protein